MAQNKSEKEVSSEFTTYYLQQATKEFAEDLDKLRSADDFKGESLPMLVKALQQGAAMFSPEDQKRIATAKGRPSQEER